MADKITDSGRIDEDNGMDFTCERWLRDNVPAPAYMSSPGSFGNAKFGLGLLAEQPGDKTLQGLGLGETGVLFGSASLHFGQSQRCVPAAVNPRFWSFVLHAGQY